MVKKLIFCMLVLLLVFPLASAVNTEIKVKTLADHKVSIFVYPSGEISHINSFHIFADSKGEVVVTHTSEDAKLDLRVKITKDGNTLFNEKFDDYQAGKPISIRIDYEEITGEYKEAVVENVTANETIEENTNVSITEVEEVNSTITGAVVSGSENKGSLSKIIFLVIIGLVVISLIVFLVVRKVYVSRQASAGKTVSSGGLQDDSAIKDFGGSEREIREIENKIKEAQKELNMLRNEGKIKTAEKKLKEDMEYLEKLKRGE